MNTNSNSANLQNVFLDNIKFKKLKTTIYLTNGVKINGYIDGHDKFCIMLSNLDSSNNSDADKKLIYKHAISTIIPSYKS